MGCPAQNHSSSPRRSHRATLHLSTKLWLLLDHLQAHDYVGLSALVSVHFPSGRSKYGHLRDSSPSHIRTNMAKTRFSPRTCAHMPAARADRTRVTRLRIDQLRGTTHSMSDHHTICSIRGTIQCRLPSSSILDLPASNRPGNVYDTHDLVVASNHTNTGTVADPQGDLVRSPRASAHS